MSVTVTLRPRIRRTAERIGRERNRSFEEMDWYENDKNTWGKDPETRNQIGLLGELAVAQYYDLTINADTEQWSDGGYDFLAVVDGAEQTIDVKSTRHDPSWLFVKEGKVTADYYILAQVRDEDVVLIGTATRSMVEKAPIEESMRYGHRNHEIQRSDLQEPPAANQVTPPPNPSGPTHYGGPRLELDRIS